MTEITRAHLKNACDNRKWDLLDKLLEIDNIHINDRTYYTDTWGEWWGLLYDCVLKSRVKGVRVLLKHGADANLGNWGDCIPYTPLALAQQRGNEKIIELLTGNTPPTYERKTDPTIPELSDKDRKINQQGQLRDDTGLVFQIDD